MSPKYSSAAAIRPSRTLKKRHREERGPAVADLGHRHHAAGAFLNPPDRAPPDPGVVLVEGNEVFPAANALPGVGPVCLEVLRQQRQGIPEPTGIEQAPELGRHLPGRAPGRHDVRSGIGGHRPQRHAGLEFAIRCSRVAHAAQSPESPVWFKSPDARTCVILKQSTLYYRVICVYAPSTTLNRSSGACHDRHQKRCGDRAA